MTVMLTAVTVATLCVGTIVIVSAFLHARMRAAIRTLLDQQLEHASGRAERVERAVREEIASGRQESTAATRGTRDELRAMLKENGDSLLQALSGTRAVFDALRDSSERQFDDFEAAVHAAGTQLRTEVTAQLSNLGDSMGSRVVELGAMQKSQLEGFGAQLNALIASNELKLDQGRTELNDATARARNETVQSIKELTDAVQQRMGDSAQQQAGQFTQFQAQVSEFSRTMEARLDSLSKTVDTRLQVLQADNEKRLEQMRQTVDEKLQGTLEKRLGDSFRLVSDRLEAVQRGLGEMQTLAAGVGDLKKVLVNVKVRGTWGEIQLSSLLEQMLSAEQFAANVAVRPDSGERVEFAVKLPGPDAGPGQHVY